MSDVLGEIERAHEARRREQIRVLSAAAYTPSFQIKESRMSKVLAALKLVLADLSKLEVPTIATAVAAVAAPAVLAIFNVDFPPGVIAGWLTLAGAAAATLQKIASGQAAPPAKK